MLKKHNNSLNKYIYTTRHIKKYIPEISTEGGASGNALYKYSFQTQKMFENIIIKNNYPQKIIACGGINSIERVNKRLSEITEGIQIYTPIIFSGTKIIRDINDHKKA